MAPHLFKGEQIYFEIYGYDRVKQIQTGYPYDCRVGEYKAMLYRVTITTPDGHLFDLNRNQVYCRAEELGLEKPFFIATEFGREQAIIGAQDEVQGRSHLDAGTLLEGVVVWFETDKGHWSCLKIKSEEFLVAESKQRDKGIGDVEDEL